MDNCAIRVQCVVQNHLHGLGVSSESMLWSVVAQRKVRNITLQLLKKATECARGQYIVCEAECQKSNITGFGLCLPGWIPVS